MYIDTHSHLNLIDTPDQIKDTIYRAKEADVSGIIVPGVDLLTSQIAYNIAKEETIVHAAAGFHPNHLQYADLETMQAISELIASPEVVAVGEIGLDYHRNSQNTAEQTKIFQHMLSIASQEAKPVIIHSRAAEDDTLSILHLYRADKIRGVWHCFEGDWELAQKILDLGFHLGFTGNITFGKNENIKEVLTKIPAERILIETDSPYLAPVPYRGQINEPAFVVEVARKIAEIKEKTIEEIAEITSDNAQKLFNL